MGRVALAQRPAWLPARHVIRRAAPYAGTTGLATLYAPGSLHRVTVRAVVMPHRAAVSKVRPRGTFSFSEVSDGSDPEFPEGFSYTGAGEVRVFATPGPEAVWNAVR
jgi:hypothetical protein